MPMDAYMGLGCMLVLACGQTWVGWSGRVVLAASGLAVVVLCSCRASPLSFF